MSTRSALITIAICLAIAYPLEKYLDRYHPPEELVEQVLYLPSGEVVKKLSFGFDGILADFYWLRSVQYFGRQLLNENQEVDWSLMSKVRYDLLYPLLDITTTLDPHYIAAYRFGALFLPDYNRDLALRLLNKGIENNPENWRLYQNLGTLYWQGKDYRQASEAFFKGSELPGAPYWMKILGGVMLTQGGSRATACQLYASFYQEALESNDNLVRTQMEFQIKQIESLDQIDYLNDLLKRYREAAGRCPGSLSQLGSMLRRNSGYTGACGQPVRLELNEKGEPVSPMGMPFRYDAEQCRATMPYELAKF